MSFFDISDLVPDPKYGRPLKVVLLVVALYPFYLLTCYMAAKGFYAYEVFGSIAGLLAPVLFMALVFVPVLLVFMGLCWGGPLLLLDRWLSKVTSTSKPLVDLAGILAANLFVLGIFLYVLYFRDPEGAARPILVAIVGSLLLGLVLVFRPHIPVAFRTAGYGVLFALALLGPMLGGQYTTSMVEAILIQFRLGGVLVTIVPSDQELEATGAALHGRLVFLSASNLYLETGCPRKLIIVPRRDSLRLEFAEIRTAGLKQFRCEGAPPPQGDSRR
jgi:hypothetical protein